ncbi:MAG: ZIP family metal transporter [Burkholderiales bacterium]|nr:ZIP family metal transporter [Burkholderiales bacterium]
MTDLELFVSRSPFLAALLASFVAGTLATAAGALPMLFLRGLSDRASNLLLSFAAGVMLAATVFSLLLPGLAAAEVQITDRRWATLGMIAALGAGGLMLWLIHRFVPHEHFCKGCESDRTGRLTRIWMFVIAIALHNVPEGMAVGIGAGSGDLKIGLGVTLGIGLQNLPEGLAVAVGLMAAGYGRAQAFWLAAATGVLETFGGLAGAGFVVLSASLLPWALGFAAGAMLFVISGEVIPETHRSGFERGATAALFVGFSAMLFLDTALL